MINLFEYQNREELTEEFDELEMFLDEIWNQREKTGYYFGEDEEEEKVEAQRFIQFLHKTGEVKSNKYVGVIHFEGKKINLLPKIFYQEGKKLTNRDVNAIQQHILWWLSYCRKIKFPNYQTSLDTEQSNFFEVLIYLFAKYTRQLLGHSIYQQYEEARREMSYIRGRLDVDRYITQNLSRARWHKVNCVFDPFVLDNRFNQIIKFVATILKNHTEMMRVKSISGRSCSRWMMFLTSQLQQASVRPSSLILPLLNSKRYGTIASCFWIMLYPSIIRMT